MPQFSLFDFFFLVWKTFVDIIIKIQLFLIFYLFIGVEGKCLMVHKYKNHNKVTKLTKQNKSLNWLKKTQPNKKDNTQDKFKIAIKEIKYISQ